MKTDFQPININLDINTFSLYLNVVGGHSFLLKYLHNILLNV